MKLSRRLVHGLGKDERQTKEVTCDNERVRLEYKLETLLTELSNGFNVIE